MDQTLVTPTPTWTSFPVLLLLSWVAWEAFLVVRGRRTRTSSPASIPIRLATWFLRPWAAWAALSIVYRLNWRAGFNKIETFPFYARPWHGGETWGEAAARLLGSSTVWGWSAVALALSAVLLLVVRALFRAGGERRVVPLLTILLLLGTALPLAIGCLPEGVGDSEREGSLLFAWCRGASTMLYCIPHIQGTDHFLRHFEEIQPQLKVSIHGASHPPLASLSLYWLGGLFGPSEDFRDDRLAYAVSLTIFSSLSILAVFLLARSLFGSSRTGLLAAALWTASPSLLAHHTFAPDGVYEPFFVLALWLIWHVATAPGRPFRGIAALGAVLFVLSLLNFSWVIPAAIAVLLVLARGRRLGWGAAEHLWRGLAPLAIALALLGVFLLAYDLDYLAVYRWANRYVGHFYRFTGPYQWVAAVVGGQVEFFVMQGAVVCSLFLGSVLPGWWRDRNEDAVLFGAVVMAVYAATIVFGPVKMETARCWSWVGAVPVAFVADRLLALPSPRAVAVGAVALSLGQYYLMRLFVCYIG